jgi:hypothetical protein
MVASALGATSTTSQLLPGILRVWDSQHLIGLGVPERLPDLRQQFVQHWICEPLEDPPLVPAWRVGPVLRQEKLVKHEAAPRGVEVLKQTLERIEIKLRRDSRTGLDVEAERFIERHFSLASLGAGCLAIAASSIAKNSNKSLRRSRKTHQIAIF